MNETELVRLQAAKQQLLVQALLYARVSVERDDASTAEDRLCRAAKVFVRTVDAIEPKLWEQPESYG